MKKTSSELPHIHLVFSSHWERYLPFQYFRAKLVRVLDQVLEVLESGRLPYYQIDGQFIPVQDYQEIRPEKEALLRRLVAEGRFKIGSWFTLPDEFLVSGESLVRNFQTGMRRATAFGQTSLVGWLCHIFGHNSQKPQVLRLLCIDKAILWRGVPPGLGNPFTWRAADRSEVTTHIFPSDGYCEFGFVVRRINICARVSLCLFLALAPGVWCRSQDDVNLLSALNDTDTTPLVDDPWDNIINGVITAQKGAQMAVDDEGKVGAAVLGPGIAVGDLNGDGLADIVMADPRGYFWFFPNSGTPTAPKFTSGEVMPIWLGEPLSPINSGLDYVTRDYSADGNDNVVPRIQLVDYSGERRLSIVAGNYEGKLFYIHNIGSSSHPAFSIPEDLSAITVGTYSDNHLWCNYLAPFLYDFAGNGHFDLVMGEGTYSANSIYLLENTGDNAQPLFTEKATTKIIPGYGREHLTPQVVDWNSKGKADIICGERQGYIDLFLDTSTDSHRSKQQFDNPPPPAAPQRISCGGVQQFGQFTTVAVADLTNNKLPNLIISNSDEQLRYALNKGAPGTPDLEFPQPIRGISALPKVFQAPPNWRITKAFAMPYVLLVSTKVQDDPSFKPPDDAPQIKSALKIYTVPHTHTYYKNEVYPLDDTHVVRCDSSILLQSDTDYDISFWVKTDGDVQNLRFLFAGFEDLASQGIQLPGGEDSRFRWVYIPKQMPTSVEWVQVKDHVKFDPAIEGQADSVGANFYFAFNGNGGTVWVTGFDMRKRQ